MAKVNAKMAPAIQLFSARSLSPSLMSSVGYKLLSSLRETTGASRSKARMMGAALPMRQSPDSPEAAALSGTQSIALIAA